MSEPTVEPAVSRDAKHSSYEPATDVEETNPPAGPQVIQTLGVPVPPEGSTDPQTTTKTTTSKTSGS